MIQSIKHKINAKVIDKIIQPVNRDFDLNITMFLSINIDKSRQIISGPIQNQILRQMPALEIQINNEINSRLLKNI